MAEPTGALAELVDVDALRKRWSEGVFSEAEAISRSLLAEVVHRRETAERDLRFMQQQMDEVGSLKRRITALRRALFELQDATTIPVIADMARWAHEADTACRRRFELKQRKASRRG